MRKLKSLEPLFSDTWKRHRNAILMCAALGAAAVGCVLMIVCTPSDRASAAAGSAGGAGGRGIAAESDTLVLGNASGAPGTASGAAPAAEAAAGNGAISGTSGNGLTEMSGVVLMQEQTAANEDMTRRMQEIYDYLVQLDGMVTDNQSTLEEVRSKAGAELHEGEIVSEVQELLQGDVVNLGTRMTDLHKGIAELKEELSRLQSSLQSGQTTNQESISRSLEKLETSVKGIGTSYDSAISDVGKLVEKLQSEDRSRFQDIADKLSSLQKNLESSRSDNLSAVEKQLSELKTTYHDDMSRLQSQVKSDLSSESKNLRGDIEDLEDKVEGIASASKSMQGDVTKLGASTQDAKETLSGLGDKMEQAVKAGQAAQKGVEALDGLGDKVDKAVKAGEAAQKSVEALDGLGTKVDQAVKASEAAQKSVEALDGLGTKVDQAVKASEAAQNGIEGLNDISDKVDRALKASEAAQSGIGGVAAIRDTLKTGAEASVDANAKIDQVSADASTAAENSKGIAGIGEKVADLLGIKKNITDLTGDGEDSLDAKLQAQTTSLESGLGRLEKLLKGSGQEERSLAEGLQNVETSVGEVSSAVGEVSTSVESMNSAMTQSLEDISDLLQQNFLRAVEGKLSLSEALAAKHISGSNQIGGAEGIALEPDGDKAAESLAAGVSLEDGSPIPTLEDYASLIRRIPSTADEGFSAIADGTLSVAESGEGYEAAIGIDDPKTLPAGFYDKPVLLQNTVENRGSLETSVEAGGSCSLEAGYYTGGSIQGPSLEDRTVTLGPGTTDEGDGEHARIVELDLNEAVGKLTLDVTAIYQAGFEAGATQEKEVTIKVVPYATFDNFAVIDIYVNGEQIGNRTDITDHSPQKSAEIVATIK